MGFSLGIAFAVAGVTSVALVVMGVKNQRSGWRRKKADDVLEILMTWAEAKSYGRSVRQVKPAAPVTPAAPAHPVQAPAAPLALTSQLVALHGALQPGSGAPARPEPVESTRADIVKR